MTTIRIALCEMTTGKLTRRTDITAHNFGNAIAAAQEIAEYEQATFDVLDVTYN